MLVYKNELSKKGNWYKGLYYQFASGKLYKLTGIPIYISYKLIDSLNIPCIDEVDS